MRRCEVRILILRIHIVVFLPVLRQLVHHFQLIRGNCGFYHNNFGGICHNHYMFAAHIHQVQVPEFENMISVFQVHHSIVLSTKLPQVFSVHNNIQLRGIISGVQDIRIIIDEDLPVAEIFQRKCLLIDLHQCVL